MEFPLQVASTTYSILLPATFEPIYKPARGLLMINLRNGPLHDMACVVKFGNPPEWR